MAIRNVECIQRLSRYLDVPAEKIYLDEKDNIVANNLANESITGFSTIVQALIKKSQYSKSLKDPVTVALTRQWLEYFSLYLSYINDGNCRKQIFKELNSVLKSSTYLCNTKKSVADIVFYYGIHEMMQKLPAQDKIEYIHLCRWFDNIQQDDKLRQTMDLINLNMIHLYI